MCSSNLAGAHVAAHVEARKEQQAQKLKDQIEDILITLGNQYHLIRLLGGRNTQGLFFYMVLNKQRSNLAMARHQLRNIEENLQM